MWTLDFFVPQSMRRAWLLNLPEAGVTPSHELSLWDTLSLCALATCQPTLPLGAAKHSK